MVIIFIQYAHMVIIVLHKSITHNRIFTVFVSSHVYKTVAERVGWTRIQVGLCDVENGHLLYFLVVLNVLHISPQNVSVIVADMMRIIQYHELVHVNIQNLLVFLFQAHRILFLQIIHNRHVFPKISQTYPKL